ncbi:MAG TPA: HEAT repeat domain-containing protein [Sedimentisphaerales bacterium]|nr:HEAT repeat domain-containing protein [Sedimentisphaerales bacterium]
MHNPEVILTKNRVSAIVLLGACFVLVTGCQNQWQNLGGGTVSRESLRQQAIETVKTGLSGPGSIDQIYAAEIVAETQLRNFTPELRSMLRSDMVPVRFAAAVALGDLKYLPARRAIEEALRDPDHNVRIAAAYALTRFLPDKTHVRLIYEGLSSNDQTVRANAALLLGKLRDPSALTALRWAMSDRGSVQDTRTQAAHSIALIGDETIYPTIWTLLISSFANYRILGVEAMGALGDARARNAVHTMLQDGVLDVQLAAAEHLGALGDPSGERVVLEYLRNPGTAGDALEQERQRVRAARAIGSIGTAALAEFLPQLMQDRSAIVRLAAARSAIQLTK